MSKITKIHINNFKAIAEKEMDFKGCTAIIIGGNNKGKSSFLKGIQERIRGIRPDIMIREGEKAGSGELTLDTGEKFIWEFNDAGKDKLIFQTKEGFKTPSTREIGKKYFPPMFDIDRFLQSSAKEQTIQLQKIVGLDFTDIDFRYTAAYNDRTEKNRLAEKFHAKIKEMLEVPKVEPVDLTELTQKKVAERTRLNNLYLQNKNSNECARNKWMEEKKAIDESTNIFNQQQNEIASLHMQGVKALNLLLECGYNGTEVSAFLIKLQESAQPIKVAESLYPNEPEYIQEMPDDSTLQEIDNQILAAQTTNQRAAEYQNYVDYVLQVEQAKIEAENSDSIVKAIEFERKQMVEKANMPKGISFATDGGILVDGLPLNKEQISTSKLYCAALRLASLNLGEVKSIHFDASTLDKFTLGEIQEWANENDMQLLIEKPDWDGGEIRYELIETTNG